MDVFWDTVHIIVMFEITRHWTDSEFASIYLLIIRPSRSRSAAAHSDETFPRTICLSVCRCVGLCVGASVCPVHCGKTANRIRMPFGCLWHHWSDGSRNEAGIVRFGDWSTGGGTFGAILGRAIVTNGDFTAYTCATMPCQITLGKLFKNMVNAVTYVKWFSSCRLPNEQYKHFRRGWPPFP